MACSNYIKTTILRLFKTTLLTRSMLLVSFYTLWKHHKISGFLMFSGGIEKDQYHKSLKLLENISTIILKSSNSIQTNETFLINKTSTSSHTVVLLTSIYKYLMLYCLKKTPVQLLRFFADTYLLEEILVIFIKLRLTSNLIIIREKTRHIC